MIETLEQLAQYVQRSVPEPRSLRALQAQENSNYVSFEWNATRFVIKKSLQVFEIRGQSLQVTGSSILMQETFVRSERLERILSVLIDSMHQAQTLVANEEDVTMGLELLAGAKESLRKLIGPVPAGHPSRIPRSETPPALAPQPECAVA